MSEKQIERETQTEKTVDETEEKLNRLERELAELEMEERASPAVTTKEVTSPEELFKKEIPAWTKKPFMYIIPPNAAMKESWKQKWSNLILTYCRYLTAHVISVEQLRHKEPFKNMDNGKQLSLDQMREVVNYLIEKNLAKWLDDEQIRARIYFLTLEEMAEMMLKYVLEKGLDTELAITLPEFRSYGQPWSNLPDEDLDEVFRILERRKKIRPIDKKRDAFTFRM